MRRAFYAAHIALWSMAALVLLASFAALFAACWLPDSASALVSSAMVGVLFAIVCVFAGLGAGFAAEDES